MISARIEDYLEELFLLECTGSDITVTDLAERLKITKATVTATVQKLVELQLVKHERYGALHLTDEGRRKGQVVFRRHEGFRAFFHEMLGLDRDHSSEMACNMEHYVDAVTEDRLYALLEFFRRAKAEHEPWVDELFNSMEKPILLPTPLTLCQKGNRGTILRLTADEPLRKNLINHGLTTGTKVTLLDITPDTGPEPQTVYLVRVKQRHLELSQNEAATIWILAKE